ncbi:MAG: hypothetical protein AAF721_17265, partial [Myxococcota bacterium]
AQPPPAAAQPAQPQPAAPAASPPQPAPAPQPKIEDSPFAAQLWKMGADAVVSPEEQAAASAPPPTPAASPAAATPINGTPRTAPTTPPNGSLARPPAPGPAPATSCVGPSPCAPPPPADGVIPWEELEPFQAWELLLGRIRPVDEFQCAVLEQVGLIALTGGSLEIAASRGSFSHMEMSKHPERRAQLEQAMRDHFGAPFSVQLVEGEPSLPDLPSMVLVQQQRREEHRVAIEAEARAHPALRNLIDAFAGEMTRIKPLGDP